MHTFVEVMLNTQSCAWEHRPDTANLRTKILDLRGFCSSIILILRGGISRPIGDFPETLSQRILAGRIVVGRLGVRGARLFAARAAPFSGAPCLRQSVPSVPSSLVSLAVWKSAKSSKGIVAWLFWGTPRTFHLVQQRKRNKISPPWTSQEPLFFY